MRQGFITIASVLGVAALSAPASAATYDLGTVLAPGENFAWNTTKLTTANQLDTYVFTMTGLSQQLGAVGDKFRLQSTSVAGLLVQLFSGSSLVAAESTDVGAVGSQTYYTNSYTDLAAGVYTVKVTSTAPLTGSRAISYGLSIFTIAPSPTPGPAGLLVFGAGAAAVAYRRRKAKPAAA